jgi:HEPN domain-containing protein
MRSERLPPDTPGEWLNRAESDLAIAGSRIEGAYLEDLCYHAQQSVEKALKALLLRLVGEFPYIHDIGELLNTLKKVNVVVPGDVLLSAALTEYAVSGRYPGFDEPVTSEQWRDAVAKASEVMEWVKAELARTEKGDGHR